MEISISASETTFYSSRTATTDFWSSHTSSSSRPDSLPDLPSFPTRRSSDLRWRSDQSQQQLRHTRNQQPIHDPVGYARSASLTACGKTEGAAPEIGRAHV